MKTGDSRSWLYKDLIIKELILKAKDQKNNRLIQDQAIQLKKKEQEIEILTKQNKTLRKQIEELMQQLGSNLQTRLNLRRKIMITIKAMSKEDIKAVALVHSQAFSRQFASRKWITCNFSAYPRIMMFVAVNELNQIVGYIQWLQKSGFRKETVIELEQIAVLPVLHGQNIGTTLIIQSLKLVKEYLSSQNSILKAVIVTTRSDNSAQRLYEKTLGVKANSIIKDLYSHDEVVMVSRFL